MREGQKSEISGPPPTAEETALKVVDLCQLWKPNYWWPIEQYAKRAVLAALEEAERIAIGHATNSGDSIASAIRRMMEEVKDA